MVKIDRTSGCGRRWNEKKRIGLTNASSGFDNQGHVAILLESASLLIGKDGDKVKGSRDKER
jgi:hypothetical protein